MIFTKYLYIVSACKIKPVNTAIIAGSCNRVSKDDPHHWGKDNLAKPFTQWNNFDNYPKLKY